MAHPSRTLTKINIIARRFDETLAFYRLLGFDLPEALDRHEETLHAQARTGEGSFAIDNEALARLYTAEWRRPGARNSVLLTVQVASRAEVDAMFAALVAAGHEAIQPPWDAFWGARYAVIADPEGNSVGLESPVDDDMRRWPPVPSPDT